MDEIAKAGPARHVGDVEAEVVVVGRFELNKPSARARLEYFGSEEMKGRTRSSEDLFSLNVHDVERVAVTASEPPFSPR